MKMNENDILTAFVSYTGKDGQGKKRSVLLIAKDYHLLYVFRMTSKFENKSEVIRKQYYPIAKWKEAGLRKPSYIDIGEARTIDSEKIKAFRIGHLALEDQLGLTNFIKKFYNNH